MNVGKQELRRGAQVNTDAVLKCLDLTDLEACRKHSLQELHFTAFHMQLQSEVKTHSTVTFVFIFGVTVPTYDTMHQMQMNIFRICNFGRKRKHADEFWTEPVFC